MARGSTQKKAIDTKTMMEVYQEPAIPGAPHKLLASMAGKEEKMGEMNYARKA